MTYRSVALFAHNEAAGIVGSIAALRAAGLRPGDKVFVLVNGSTDQTLSLVQAAARLDPRIHPVEIALGDKANAWDVYVHRLADPAAALHIFIDGDVQVSAGAFDRIEQTAQAYPAALVISTLPRGGRQSVGWAQRIQAHHGMPGNFYAIPGPVFARLQAQVWLPVGFMGDDSLLRWLLLRDLDPAAEPRLDRVRPCPQAFFDYASFPVTTLTGLKRLWRRHLGYARRELQVHVLCGLLARQGLAAMPRQISQVHDQIRPLRDSVTARVGFRGRRLLLPFVAWRLRGQTGSPRQPAWYDLAPAPAKGLS